MENIKFELKYCERCGTLKLRRVDSVSTYCRRCEGLLARYTSPSGVTAAKTAPLRRVRGMLAAIPPPVSSGRIAGRAQ